MIQWLKRLFAPWLEPKNTEPSAPVEEQTAAAETEPQEPRRPVKEIATGRPFREFELDADVLRGLEEAEFTHCTPIQDLSLPITLKGKDLAAQAQTGSGKTAVFLITIFERLLQDRRRGASDGRALILAPTRELALQIYRDAELLGKYTPFRAGVVVGGVAYQSQIDAIKQGAEIIIATPGRLIDLMKQHIFDPRRVSILVIDEADRMLDMGFIRDLRYIMKRVPHYSRRQSMLFSATLSLRVLELTYEYMNMPEEVSISPEEPVVDTVEQCLFHVARNEKFGLLLGLLQREQCERVLIFCNTKVQTATLARRLEANGYRAKAITGDLPQKQRISILGRFSSGEIDILVATDVASRGIHVEDVTHVINYDVPQDREEYVHRIGRTARAGKAGKAFTLASEQDVYYLEPIEEYLGKKIPVVWPEEDWFVRNWRKEKRPERRPGGAREGQRRRGGKTAGGKGAKSSAAKGAKSAPAKGGEARKSEGRKPRRRRPRKKRAPQNASTSGGKA